MGSWSWDTASWDWRQFGAGHLELGGLDGDSWGDLMRVSEGLAVTFLVLAGGPWCWRTCLGILGARKRGVQNVCFLSCFYGNLLCGEGMGTWRRLGVPGKSVTLLGIWVTLAPFGLCLSQEHKANGCNPISRT